MIQVARYLLLIVLVVLSGCDEHFGEGRVVGWLVVPNCDGREAYEARCRVCYEAYLPDTDVS